MSTERKERRRFERILFSDEDGITGIFTSPGDHQRSITANIMDLGEDGMCLVLKQGDEEDDLHEGNHLILTEIKGTKDLQFLTNMEMEIRWTLNLKHLAVGCEFLNISQTFREQIRQFMNSWGETLC